MADPNLKITVSGDTSKADAALAKLEVTGNKIANNLGASLGKTFQFNQLVAGVENVYRIVSPLIKRGTEEAQESAEAQAMINATAKESVPLINAYADAVQRRLAIDDETTVRMAAQIAARGKSVGLQGEELRMATQLGLQYGALKGNYESAAMAIGKYIGSEGTGLKGINVEVEKGADLHTKLEAALKATAGGMEIMTAQANNSMGAWRGLNLQIDEYLGKLTAAVTDNPKVSAALREMTELIADEVASGDMKQMASDIGDLAHELVELAKFGKELEPLTYFLSGKWFFQGVAKGDDLIGKPLRDAIFGADEATKTLADSATAVGDAFAIAEDTVSELPGELKAAAAEADAMAKAQTEAYIQWNADVDALEKKRADSAAEYYKGIHTSVMKMLDDIAAREAKQAADRLASMQAYGEASKSAQGWIRLASDDISEMVNKASGIAAGIKLTADHTERFAKLNIANMPVLQQAASDTSVMASEMQRAADGAERTSRAMQGLSSYTTTVPNTREGWLNELTSYIIMQRTNEGMYGVPTSSSIVYPNDPALWEAARQQAGEFAHRGYDPYSGDRPAGSQYGAAAQGFLAGANPDSPDGTAGKPVYVRFSGDSSAMLGVT